MEQYKQMQAEAQARLREERIRAVYEVELEKLTRGATTNSKLLDPQFWLQFSRGGLTVSPPAEQHEHAIRTKCDDSKPPYQRGPWKKNNVTNKKEILRARGFLVCDGEQFELDWEAVGVSMTSISETMQALKDAGWPPIFILMYDQPWKLLQGLFDVLGPLMGDPEIELEASIAAWALDHPSVQEVQHTAREKVGNNFGVPHRDLAFDKCHRMSDGESSVMNVWVPVVDATLENGCMYVIPREHDPLFDKCAPGREYEAHVSAFKNLPYQHVLPLPASAGTPILWHSNTIHWGSSCSPYAEVPRKSVAMAFRLPEQKMEQDDEERAKQMKLYGHKPFTRAELENGLSMKERLQMSAQSILMYSVWYPEYDGMDATQFQ